MFVVDSALVLAVSQFVKEKFGLEGWAAFAVAAVVALAVYILPQALEAYPAIAPFVEYAKILFGAAGAYQFIKPKPVKK